MNITQRIEGALNAALARAEGPDAPPKLASALRYAVFPGGARVRPQLSLAVAGACGDDLPGVSDAAAAAIELLHCASLVHDDLPCFDDAETRRGKPTVHCVYGAPLAVLAGDALIVMAFETLARGATAAPGRMIRLLRTVAWASGTPSGLVAGQAWESEPAPALEAYHGAKTGALFTAATMTGAIAAGADPEPWRAMGQRIGEAYQVADDLTDVAGDPDELGKPVARDAELLRPSAVAELGVEGALARLQGLVAAAAEAVPECAGAADLRALVRMQAERLVPKALRESAA